MHQFGGIYVDMDFEALRPLTPLLHDSKIVVGREKGGIGMHFRGRDFVCNALLASPAGHPMWLDVMQEMVRRHRPRHKLEREPFYVLRMTVELFDAVVEPYAQTHSDLVITSHEVFYPAPPTCRLAQERREIASKLDSYAIHHFEGSWLGWRDRAFNLLQAIVQWWQKRMHKSR
jgi:mannosyltransferase OCH1-like enzyme